MKRGGTPTNPGITECVKRHKPNSDTPVLRMLGQMTTNSLNNDSCATKHAESDTNNDNIDENLYSRQLYVLGSDAMRKMNKCSVLIVGSDGISLEIAKNIILGGVRAVTVCGAEKSYTHAQSSHYYCTNDDFGRNLSEISVEKLSKLNEYVRVCALTEFPSQECLSDINIIVIVNKSYDEIDMIYEAARPFGIKIIIVHVYGLVGRIFCDFGEEFTVYDSNGEEPVQARLDTIENTPEGLAMCLEEKRHGFEDGDYVKFSEVEGMPEINNSNPVKITVKNSYSFFVGDLSNYKNFGHGGVATQVKMPTKISFKSFRESLSNPTFVIGDFEKFERPSLYHLLFFTIHNFVKKYGYFPKPHCAEDANLFISLVHSLNGISTPKVDKLDDNFIRMFCYQSSGDLCPMASFFGGVAAQEVFKAATGKFTPIFQNYFFDCFECLPKNYIDLPDSDFQLSNSRYDKQIAVFGKTLQDKLSKMNLFVVGSGAIGCEHLKNLCMMGIGTQSPGEISITDMDTIERSNLNRQFLFRNSDIGRFKSEAACRSALDINPHIRLRPLIQRVGPETEKIFNDKFYRPIDVVLNALDNIEARTYMDQKCLFYQKPLLESGTLGPKGSVQSVVPRLTESYSSSYDPPEKAIPLCTLKNFPYLPEHVIQWARDLFEGLFCQWPALVNKFSADPKVLYKESGAIDLEKITILKNAILSYKTSTFMDCVKWAKHAAKKYFGDEIEQIIFSFPKDKLNQYGVPFWSGTKRFPQTFNVSDSGSNIYQTFILSASKLRAQNIGVKCDLTDSQILEFERTIHFEKFVPKSNFFIATTDSEINAQKSVEDSENQQVKKIDDVDILKQFIDEAKLNFSDIIFEKDDDTNHHIEFIYAASNLRAFNYRIPESDKLTVKLIAGKIVPAIATTTAAISGLACLELYKLAQGFNEIGSYRNSFLNLALGFSTFSEPIKCPVKKFGDIEFTMWDKFEVDALSPKDPTKECTMQEFFEIIKNKYNIEADMVSHGTCLIYAPFMDSRKRSERLFQPISNVIEVITKTPLDRSNGWLLIDVTCQPLNDEDEESPDIPSILYILPKQN